LAERSFQKVQLEDLPLEFTLDTDDNGKYIAEVYTVLDGKREKVKDIRKIWNYGFTIEDGKIRDILSQLKTWKSFCLFAL